MSGHDKPDDLAPADDEDEKHPDFTGADGNRYIWSGGRYVIAPGLPRAQRTEARPKVKALKGYPRIGVDAEGSYYILDAVSGGGGGIDPNTGEPLQGSPSRLQWREMTPDEYLEAEDAGVFDEDGGAGGGGLTAYQGAQLARQQRQDQLELERYAREEARDAELLRFNRDKWAVEVEQGKTQEARMTQQLGEQIQARLESNRIEREQLQQRQLENQQQLQLSREAAGQRSREFEATFGQREREFAADEAARAEQQGLARQQEQRQRAETAGVLAQNPGDVGKLAGFLTAGGLSPISTMLGQGQTAITDRSLEPLAALLASSEASASPAAASGPQLVNGIDPTRDYTPDEYREVMQRANAPGGALHGWSLLAQRGHLVPQAEDGAGVVSMDSLMALAKMMGMKPKAIAGEKGKANGETVWSNGDVVITPDRGEGTPRMQGGGFAGQYGSALDPRLLALARQFLAQSGKTALERSGFGAPPSPIELSDPGTSGFLRQLGAATTAATKGINPQAYMEELNRLIPQAQSFGLMRRSI